MILHIVKLLRIYLGMTQSELARAAGISQCDVSEIETLAPYGTLNKYRKLSAYFGVPIDILLTNDARELPVEFFERHPRLPDKSDDALLNKKIGRLGEQYVYEMEYDLVSERYPGLANLIMPVFRYSGWTGFDMISFDADGRPCAIEVKTSLLPSCHSTLTAREYETACQFIEEGYHYYVVMISQYGTEDQQLACHSFDSLRQEYDYLPNSYVPVPKLQTQPPMLGMEYYRHLRGMSQSELGEQVGMNQDKICIYESGRVEPSVDKLLTIAAVLGTSVSSLLTVYDPYTGRPVSDPSTSIKSRLSVKSGPRALLRAKGGHSR